MRPTQFHRLALLSLLGIALCGCTSRSGGSQSSDEATVYEAETEAEAIATEESDPWALFDMPTPTLDTSRRFIRTAEFRFRVKDLQQSIRSIETTIRQQGGFVESSDLNNTVLSRQTVPISADSLIETTTYELSCTMTLRVPAEQLDTTLHALARHIDFPDYRRVQAKDATIDLLEQRLTGDRYRKYEPDLRRQARKDSSVTPLINHAAEADRARLQQLRLNDRIRFSTITLEIYQREQTRHEVLPNQEDIRAYKPGFWSEAGDSLTAGFHGLQVVILLLLRIWWLFLIGAIVLLTIRCVKRRRQHRQTPKQ